MRRGKSEVKSYATVAGLIILALLIMAYISYPIGVRATPQVYAYGKMTVQYKDGSTDLVTTPKTPFEKTAQSLQDFFKSLSVVQRGGKEVSSIRAQFFIESSSLTAVVVKAYISPVFGNQPSLSTQVISLGYILQGGKPTELWSKTWTENELISVMPDGASTFKVVADVYMASVDGVYHAKVTLSTDLTKSQGQVGATNPSGGSDASGGTVPSSPTAPSTPTTPTTPSTPPPPPPPTQTVPTIALPSDLSAYGEIVVNYKDGTSDKVTTPRTPFEQISMTLSQMISLAVIHGGKEVGSITFNIYGYTKTPVEVMYIIFVEEYMNNNKISSYTPSSYPVHSEPRPARFYSGQDTELLCSKTISADDLERQMIQGSNKYKVDVQVYFGTTQWVTKSSFQMSVDLTKSVQATTPTATQQVVATTQPTASEVVTQPATSTTATPTTTTPSVPQVQGISQTEYVQIVEEISGKPYTDQVTVQVRDGGYQPAPGTLAAQDQYCYDVTDLFYSLQQSGSAPTGWTWDTDRFGQTVYYNPETGSTVVVGVTVSGRVD